MMTKVRCTAVNKDNSRCKGVTTGVHCTVIKEDGSRCRGVMAEAYCTALNEGGSRCSSQAVIWDGGSPRDFGLCVFHWGRESKGYEVKHVTPGTHRGEEKE